MTFLGDTGPVKIFDRTAVEGLVSIINYRISANGKFIVLGGISAGPGGNVVGVLQIFSVDLNTSQPLMDAHAACFSTVTLDGRSTPSNLLCFTKLQEDQQMRVC